MTRTLARCPLRQPTAPCTRCAIARGVVRETRSAISAMWSPKKMRSPHTRVRSTVTAWLPRKLTKALARAGPTMSRITLVSRSVLWCFSASELQARQALRVMSRTAPCISVASSSQLVSRIFQLWHISRVAVEVGDEVGCISTVVNIGAGVSKRHNWIMWSVARRKHRNGMLHPDPSVACINMSLMSLRAGVQDLSTLWVRAWSRGSSFFQS